VSELSGGGNRFRSDDGSADPQVAAALAAFAAGRGGEHAALTALADSRLLVPVLAALTTATAQPAGHQDTTEGQDTGAQKDTAGCQDTGAQKASDMALPTLVGADGRHAVPAFTSLAALTRWQAAARPVPTEAGLVWRAAVAESCAVVIDIAGPVPLAVEGARLTALARGQAPPLPHEDPDILLAVTAAVAEHASGARFSVGPPAADAADASDLTIRLTSPAGAASASAAELARLIGAGVMTRLGGRLRRGVAIVVSPAADDRIGR
jgi:type III secretion system (T3SS) SseB-like protein